MGGIERITQLKANALAQNAGNELYVIVTDHREGTEWQILSPKVRLIDLKVNYFKNDWKSKTHYLYSIFCKWIVHYRRLRKELKRIQPDIVISTGLGEKFLLPFISGDFRKVREFHFSRNNRKQVMEGKGRFYRTIGNFADFIDNRIMLSRYDKIYTLTHKDKNLNWIGYDNVEVIPNPVTFEGECPRNESRKKKLISAGRLVDQKNYESLIRIFRKINDKYPDWILEIYGEGHLKTYLEQLIDKLELKGKVFLNGSSADMRAEFLKSSIFVMTSKYEGFPLVLLEAAYCGLPMVAFDCECGPSDIIEDGENGYLIEPGNDKQFVDRLISLIEDSDKRQKFGRRALETSLSFSMNRIMKLWEKSFHQLLSISKN